MLIGQQVHGIHADGPQVTKNKDPTFTDFQDRLTNKSAIPEMLLSTLKVLTLLQLYVLNGRP